MLMTGSERRVFQRQKPLFRSKAGNGVFRFALEFLLKTHSRMKPRPVLFLTLVLDAWAAEL